MQNESEKTLKLDRPVGAALLRAVLIVLVLLAAAEGLARLPWVAKRLETASLGNYHYQFEIKWFHLQRYVEAHDGVDVILLGSSLVNSGIDPDAVNQTFMADTGEAPLRIYNFGVEGLTVQANVVVAQLLVESYHPQTILFGTEIRDYAANNGVETAENFLSDPWVQYRMGDWNLRGWLAEHSVLYRYFLAYRNWMRWDFAENHALVIKRTQKLTEAGYDVENRVAEDPYRAPDHSDPEDAEAFVVFAGFQMDAGRLANLQNLLDIQQTDGVQVLLVEMPVTPQFFDYFEDGMAAHDHFVDEVSARAAAAGVPFFPAIPEEMLPANGRSDRVHMSRYGAEVYSQALGDWLAEISLQDGIDLRTGGGQ